MKSKRHKTRAVKIGRLHIGADYPVLIQSMTKTKTSDITSTIRQIKELESAGCEIVRLAIKDKSDAAALREIKIQTKMPVVADIHFDWRLGLMAIENGADKIRLNPGNIYKKDQVCQIVSALKQAGLPLRIGVNSGSVRNLNATKLSMPERLVQSALSYIKMIEKMKFYDIVISLKGSNIFDTIAAYRKIAKLCDYPLHLGVTACGLPAQGLVKSSLALGVLLLEGIGDTLRISLTASPEEEVKAAKYLLSSLDLRHFGPEIISCPTCGRCAVDLIKIVQELENKIAAGVTAPLKVAVMGCLVNGPGEAKEADLGVAFGKTEGLLFKKGKALKKCSFDNCVEVLMEEIRRSVRWQR